MQPVDRPERRFRRDFGPLQEIEEVLARERAVEPAVRSGERIDAEAALREEGEGIADGVIVRRVARSVRMTSRTGRARIADRDGVSHRLDLRLGRALGGGAAEDAAETAAAVEEGQDDLAVIETSSVGPFAKAS